MKQIPLYDATTPIACTITAAEIPARIELVERMRTNLTSIERTPHGLLLRFPNRADIAAGLHRFTIDEKRCCQFWGFEILTDGELELRWDAPPVAADLIDQLEAFFRGNQAASTLAGLL